MNVIRNLGSGYYNYYQIKSRHSCEKPKEAWYKTDLSTREICSNNNVQNKDSENASAYRRLEDAYASAAASNRAKYSSVEELQSALSEKYSIRGAYANYSSNERNAMYLNELSMTCFGMIDCHSGMGGGDIMADPHIKGEVETNAMSSAASGKNILNAQIKNVFSNFGINAALFGNNCFSFQIDPFTKYLTVSLMEADPNFPLEDELLQQMEDALNSNKNGSNLFYNLLYENNRQGMISNDVLEKFRLMDDFRSVTGLDIRTFVQTQDGFFSAGGENALDLYRKGLQTTQKIPAEYKGIAYDYFNQRVTKSLSVPISTIPDLSLTTGYKNGMVIKTADRSTLLNGSISFSRKV